MNGGKTRREEPVVVYVSTVDQELAKQEEHFQECLQRPNPRTMGADNGTRTEIPPALASAPVAVGETSPGRQKSFGAGKIALTGRLQESNHAAVKQA